MDYTLLGVGLLSVAMLLAAWWAIGVRDRLDMLHRDHERELGHLEGALADLVNRERHLEGALTHLGLQSCHKCGRWGIPSSEMCRVTPLRVACADCLPAVLDPSETTMSTADLERVADWLDNTKLPMELVDRCIAARPALWRALKQVEEDRSYERLREQAGTS